MTLSAIHRILAPTAICFAAVACNSHTEAAPQLKENTYYQRTGVSMGDLRRLPFVDGDPEAIKKAYDTITFQAVSSGETLTVTIKNTGKKNSKNELIYSGSLWNKSFSSKWGSKKQSRYLKKKQITMINKSMDI